MLTEGHLARHYGGRKGGRDPALIDIAQDHALKLLDEAGAFALGAVFKGGTAIRKFHAGNAGRFSTDLDFSASDPDVAQLILDTFHDVEFQDFRFSVRVVRTRRQATLDVTSSTLGTPTVSSKIDISPRAVWLPAKLALPIVLPVHRAYAFPIPSIPVMRTEEILAEKLARYRRRPIVRDLYDLAWFSDKTFDEAMVRRLLVLKVWHDVIEDKLGDRPFDPGTIVSEKRPEDFIAEDIGVLTQSIDIPGWLTQVQRRYAFVLKLDEDERDIARCSPGEKYKASKMIEGLFQP